MQQGAKTIRFPHPRATDRRRAVMPEFRLTQRRVDALRPRRKVQTVRDTELKGYGVRATPSGARRYFIHSQHLGRRVWKTVGDAAVMSEPEARARARSMLAALREGRDPEATDPGDTLFETVAEEVFERYGRRWKPRTLQGQPRSICKTADPALFHRDAPSRRSPARRCRRGSARYTPPRRRRTAPRRSCR